MSGVAIAVGSYPTVCKDIVGSIPTHATQTNSIRLITFLLGWFYGLGDEGVEFCN